VFLSGRGLDERDERGRTIVDNDFLVLVNAHYEAVEFKLPAQPEDARWVLRVDTTNAAFEAEERACAPGDSYSLQGRALALFEFPQARAAI
jgi:glycogen operon protein